MIITFYSYKGGTGRTMALANCACLLARNTFRSDGPKEPTGPLPSVLMVDWDLEAPGLHHYFTAIPSGTTSAEAPSEQSGRSRGGLLELFERIDEETRDWGPERDAKAIASLLSAIEPEQYTVPTGIGSLRLLKAGNQETESYARRVHRFDWVALHERVPRLFAAFARYLSTRFDYVLIDSRTGITDTSGICTTLLPEKLVVVFTMNAQSLTGLAELVKSATDYRRGSIDTRSLMVFPVPSRLETDMPELLREWRSGSTARRTAGYQTDFQRVLESAYGLTDCNLGPYFDDVGIQYVKDYAFGEPLPVELEQGSRLSLRRSYQVLTERLVRLPSPWDDLATIAAQEQIEQLRRSAQACIETGDTAGTLQSYKSALEVHRFNARVEAPDLANDLEHFARQLLASGALADASTLYEGAVTVARRVHGEDGLAVVGLLEGWATVLDKEKKHAAAVDAIRAARRARTAAGVPYDDEASRDTSNLAARILRNAGLHAEAREIARSSDPILERLRGLGASNQSDRAGRPLRVFISYAHEDDARRVELLTHLTLLRRERLIDSWHDRMIPPGGSWGSVIDEQLEAADVVILLVSAAFLASDYCWDVEVKRAMERHAAGEARVIPVIVAPVDWMSAPFGRLQALPPDAKPVASWTNEAEAWSLVAKAIRGIAEAQVSAQPAVALKANDETKYLTWLKEQHAYLEVRGLGAQVAERMELSQVYTSLIVAGADVDGRGAAKAQADSIDEREPVRAKPRELRELLAHHPHAALVGDPGSGKTTFLRFVAQNLARAHLGDTDALSKIGLEGEPLFPIFVRLEDLARFIHESPNASIAANAPEHFYRFLDHVLAGHPVALPESYLRRRVERGGCMLLLDGLDEVPGEKVRKRIAEIIGQVVAHGRASLNRHLITCRTRAYQGRVQLASLSTLHLAPFDRKQVELFTIVWSRALFRVAVDAEADDPRAQQAAEYRKSLLRAIAENPSGLTFTQNPLMLTVLAVVHWNKKRLPEQRADLYAAAVEYLLESRREHTELPTPLRRECLQAIAWRMFADPEGVLRSLGRREAMAAVAEMLGTGGDAAEAFLDEEELRSGLLVSRTEGEVEFWHLTFQEYLAALELSPLGDDAWRKLEPHLDDDRWSEVILLLAGCERRGGIREARRMITRILGTRHDAISKARAVGLVGRILRDIRTYGGDPSQGTVYEPLLRETLSIFEPRGESLPEVVRRDLGDALGQSGDPRLAEPDANKILIPGGTFYMGAQKKSKRSRGYDPEADDDEAPVHEVTVSTLRIGRFPVTVTEFGRFVSSAADGYLNQRLWHADGWAWRLERERKQPDEWETQITHPNWPVTSVSWYEADAYCRFVNGRLPTEAEWEWVARGANGRKFPWGNEEPTPNHASFDLRFQEPAPVGIYPLDVHELGVRDLAGNVWEWCADWSAGYGPELATNPAGPPTGSSRVLRGGSFNSSARVLRAAYRFDSHPEYDNDNIGFRVVWSLAGGQA